MDYIHIEGVQPYDGRYEFDLRDAAFTVREWGWIKRHSGYLPLTLWDGLLGKDAELLAIFAIIALVRASKVHRDDVPEVWERFADAPGVLTVRLELTAAEGDADPTLSESTSENGNTSGPDLKTSSVSSEATPRDSGTPGLAISESHPDPVSGS